MLPRITVTAALPVCTPLVAVIVAVPTTSPVTSPVPLTGARAGALDAQVTDRPLSTLPLASLSVAVSCTVPPPDTVVAAGLMVTEATGAGGSGVQTPTVTLQTVALPPLVSRPRWFRAGTAACSVRKANALPNSCSVAPAGVT